MRYFTIAVLLFLCSFANAQQNLVPNPSFEDTVYCPYGTNQIDACQNWLNFGNSPEYFNACTPFVGVPNQSFGFQYAHSGVGMVGICCFRKPFSPNGPNYREFIGSQLSSSTIIGTKYYISFYGNFSYKLGIASNKLGLKLSTIPFDSCCKPNLTNSALLFSDSIMSDSISWIKFTGSFIADSMYKYVMLGNFFDDQNTDTLLLINLYDAAYYYLDDVCVTTDSIYNQTWTGISQIVNRNQVIIFPNPTNSLTNIKSYIPFNEVDLYNNIGKLVFSTRFNFTNSYSLFLPNSLSNGMYLLKLSHANKSNTVHKLFVKL